MGRLEGAPAWLNAKLNTTTLLDMSGGVDAPNLQKLSKHGWKLEERVNPYLAGNGVHWALALIDNHGRAVVNSAFDLDAKVIGEPNLLEHIAGQLRKCLSSVDRMSHGYVEKLEADAEMERRTRESLSHFSSRRPHMAIDLAGLDYSERVAPASLSPAETMRAMRDMIAAEEKRRYDVVTKEELEKMISGDWGSYGLDPDGYVSPKRASVPTPEGGEIARAARRRGSDKRLAQLYEMFKTGAIRPGFSETMVDGRVFEVFEDSMGHVGTTTTTPMDRGEIMEKKDMFSTSEGDLSHASEILRHNSSQLSNDLAKVLRTDPKAFQELKSGGQLAQAVTVVIAGQRVSIELKMEGLGEETGIMG